VGIVEGVGHSDDITSASRLANLVLRNVDRTSSIALYSNDGKGALENAGVYVVDEDSEIIIDTGLAGGAVPSQHIFRFRNPPARRRRVSNLEVVLSCSERGEEQRRKKSFE